jgi:hypothetical protein
MRSYAAPVGNLVKCKTLGLAPVRKQVQKLECLVCAIISAKALQCQDKNFDIAAVVEVLYNYYINRR